MRYNYVIKPRCAKCGHPLELMLGEYKGKRDYAPEDYDDNISGAYKAEVPMYLYPCLSCTRKMEEAITKGKELTELLNAINKVKESK